MNYLVIGLSKTGTTAVYQALYDALQRAGHNPLALFEPDTAADLACLERGNDIRNAIVKMFEGRFRELGISYGLFARIIHICRDPRDTLISRLLYKIRNPSLLEIPGFYRDMRGLLEKKIADPDSVPLVEIYAALFRHRYFPALDTLRETLDKSVAMNRELSGTGFTLYYEKFVDGDIGDLCSYLGGLAINPVVDVPQHLKKVERSRGYGEWRNWFTGQDIEFFRPRMITYMEYFGYTDWRIPEHRAINRDTSIGYLDSNVPVEP